MTKLNNIDKEFKRDFIRVLKERDLIYRYKINFINLHRNFFLTRIINFYGLYNNKTFLESYNFSFDKLIKSLVFMKNKMDRKENLLYHSFRWLETNEDESWRELASFLKNN